MSAPRPYGQNWTVWSVRSLNLGSSSSASRVKCSRGVFATSFSIAIVRTPLKQSAYRHSLIRHHAIIRGCGGVALGFMQVG